MAGEIAMRRTLTIIIVLVLASIAGIALYFPLSRAMKTAAVHREMASLRADLAPGLPRSEVYARIKRHGQVAYNGAFQVWKTYPPGCIPARSPNCRQERISNGEWPDASQQVLHPEWSKWPLDAAHPYVLIYYSMGESYNCQYSAFLKIDFDSSDRLSKVTEFPNSVKCY